MARYAEPRIRPCRRVADRGAARPSDQSTEELVRQQPTAGREADPFLPALAVHLQELRGERPAELIAQRWLEGIGERQARVQPEPEDRGFDRGGRTIDLLLPPGGSDGRDPSVGVSAAT